MYHVITIIMLCITEPLVAKPSMVTSLSARLSDVIFGGNQLNLTVHVHQLEWSVLWKGCFKVKITVKVLNCRECLPGQYLWSVKLSMVMYHHQPEYHSEMSFFDVQQHFIHHPSATKSHSRERSGENIIFCTVMHTGVTTSWNFKLDCILLQLFVVTFFTNRITAK